VRAVRFLGRVRGLKADVLAFSSGHFLRVLAGGRCFYLGTAAVSVLGYEHDESEPVIRLWNQQD
jgi:hypothetical protein